MKEQERKNLYNSWDMLGERIKNLRTIVQNDVPIPPEQIKEWRDLACKYWNEIKTLTGETLFYLRNTVHVTYDVFVHPESGVVWSAIHEELPTVNDLCVERIHTNVTEQEAEFYVSKISQESGYVIK